MWVVGADGCKAGWIYAARNVRSGDVDFGVVAHAHSLLELRGRPAIVCIDIPIGLPDKGPRECDRLARSLLGWPRSSSVFPAPVRPALRATSRVEASRITEALDGRRVSAQGWALYDKIREIDALLGASASHRDRVREVHPEVSFRAWNGERAIEAGKKTSAGRAIRLRLAERWLGPGVLARARAGRRKYEVGDDDILDAIAALWTATRSSTGDARTLPAVPPIDASGLPMRIVY
jgi:predicted RNase H-like nuclease